MLHLDHARGCLLDRNGRHFDPVSASWAPADGRGVGESIDLADAVRWLQSESGRRFRAPIGVIGARKATEGQLATAEAIGESLGGLGLTVLCGGREGIMAAVCRGVDRAGGLSVGLLPDEDWRSANAHVSLPIATGLGIARNAVLARAAACLIAVGGGLGTLSEVALGLQFGRPVFAATDDAPQVEGVVALPDQGALIQEVCKVVLSLAPYGSHG